MRTLSYILCLGSLLMCLSFTSCIREFEKIEPPISSGTTDTEEQEPVKLIPNIDLNHWKLTLPIGNPTEIEPPEILDYATNDIIKPFMYNDSTDGSLVFYTYPGSTTTNSSYSRTELREQMEPGSNSVNWTFAEGGSMKGRLKMDDISKDEDDKFHRTIVMQIHGRLTNEQKELIGKSDNNAPPVLKIYWAYGRVRVLRKVLKDINSPDLDILQTEAWTDEGAYFNEHVDFNPFTLEVIVNGSRMEIILNETESMVFDDIHTQRWNVFENYFKAGNYLASTDDNAYAYVKYYDLEISH